MSERIYFSPFKDLYSGEIISCTIGQRPQTKYVLDGLKQVLASRPKLPYRMTIHSDQGIQYQFKACRGALLAMIMRPAKVSFTS